MRFFQGERNLRLDILASHREARAAASAPTAAKQALEEITKSTLTASSAKQVAKVAIFDMRTLPLRRRPEVLPRFPVLPELVVSLAFVGIGQNFVGFVYLFEFLFG